MNRKILLGLFFGMSFVFSGCVCSSEEKEITQRPTMKKVSIQLCGSKEWSSVVASVVVLPSIDSIKADSVIVSIDSVIKPAYDSSKFDLGEMKTGTKFTMMTGIGKYEYFKAPDSIRIIIGSDTTITYYPEGLEKIYIVD